MEMLSKLRKRTFITFCCITLMAITFMGSYLICEMQELRIKGAQNEYTFISKTIQLIVQTLVNEYFCFLAIKFCLLGMRMSKALREGENLTGPYTIFITLAILFNIHFMIDCFLYVYPYIMLYGKKEVCWPGYSDLQHALLWYQTLIDALKGFVMAAVIMSIAKATTPGELESEDSEQKSRLFSQHTIR